MALFSDRYYARKNGTEAAKASSASRNRKGSFSERYYADKYMRSIGVDTFDSDLKTTSDLLTNVYANWHDADSMNANRETVSSMRNRLNDLYSYTRFSGQDTTEIKKVLDAYNTALSEWDGLTEYYGGFKSGDAYTNYMKEQAKKEEESKKSAFDEYRYLLDDEEFMKNANYESAKKNMSFWDHLTDKSDLYDVNKEKKDGLLYDIDHALSKAFPVESTKYQYLTDDELSVYYGLHAQDKSKADDFLEKMSKELNKRMTDEDLEGQREFAQKNAFTGTIATIGALGNNLIGGISSLRNDIKNLVTGEEVDANDFSHIYTNRADALTEAVSESIGESTDTKVLPFLYNTGMSIANSALNLVLLGGSGSLANMSTQAYSSKMKEMQDRGASQTEMILTSALAAGIEAITEKIPMDNLLKPKGVTTLRRFIGETMKQAGIEATEEGVSSILNQTVDVLSGQLGGTSEFKNQYEDYLLRGYTEDEAKKEVAKGALEETLLSALGGAISGGFMGGVGNAMEGAENRNIGKFVTNNNRLPELTDLATEVGPIGKGKNAVDYAAQLQNSPNKATIGYAYKNIAEEANRQADELDRSETKELITRRLVEMGESGETAMDLADAIIADGNGKASAAQRRMIENSGIAAEAIQDIKSNAEWTTKSTEGLRKAQGLRDKLKSISTMRDASVVKAEQRASEMNISDTTTDIETGKEIDIEGVRFDENGEAVLQTSEGERKISEVTLTSNNAIAVAYAEDMDREMADTFVSLYDGKQDFEAYKDSFNLIWHYGQDGFGSDSVLSHLGNLTESQALSIYKAGMTSEVAKAQKAVNAIKKQYRGFAVKGSFDDSIIDYTGADSNKVDFNTLSDNQKQNIVAAKAISEGLGLKVELFSSRHGENKANGYYDPKTNTIGIDVFAEQKGGSLNNGIMTAMSHEMTHWMKSKSPKLYNEMRELVMNGLSKSSGVSGDVLAGIEAYRMDSRHGGNASDSQAIDELIARACEDMLSNSKVAKGILENMSAESRASFVDKIKEFLSKIKEAIASIMGRFDSESREAVMLREMDGMADKMAELWDSMLEDSVETNSAMAEEVEEEEYLIAASDKQLSEKVGIGFDSETNSLYPKQFSLKTWTESEYQQNVDKAVKEISKKLKVSEKKARQYIDNINSIAKMIADDRERLDYEPTDSTATSVKPNSEYKWTVDMSTLCAKRLLFTGTFDKIQKKLMNTALTSEDIVRIRQMMEERGYTVACGICYVESTRREMGPITEEFINRYKMSQKTGKPITRVNSEGKVVDLTKTKKQMEITADKSTNKFYADRNYTPTLADLNTTDIDIVKRDHPLVYEAYLNFMNARGQAKPKLLETRTEYKGEILKHFNTASAVKARNDAGGLRVQSFSDFEVAHLIDMMQIVMDMSRVGLYSQAYTKVPEFADIFGGTGMKINLSLIAKGDGLDKNGNLIFDDVEGMDHKEAFRLREKWSENVGTILVGKNDAHIVKALADPRIDFVIPFHKSSWKESLYGALGLTGYSDYTDYQNEKPLDKNRKIKNFAPSEYWDYSKTGDENAQTYLEMCRADGRIPKFPQFAHCEGYWKLLIDFKMYDNNGVGSPQRVVRPDFDMEAAKKVLNEYEGGHRSFPSADDVVEDFVNEYKKNNSGRQYSDKGTDEEVPYYYDSNGTVVLKNASYGFSLNKNDYQNVIDVIKNDLLDLSGTSVVIKSDNRRVFFDKEGAGEYTRSQDSFGKSNTKRAAKMNATKALPSIVENATEPKLDKNRKPKHNVDAKKGFVKYSLEFGIEDAENNSTVYFTAELIVRVARNGVSYVYDVEKIRKNLNRSLDSDESPESKHLDSFKEKISQNGNSVKQYSDKYDVTELSADDYAALAKHFGTTGNFNVAGYMLTDGKMLDFSGKHWGDTTSKTRQVDHRDIQEVLDSEYNGFDTMVNMISNGNIRLMPESGGINLAVAPTKNQRTVLRRYIEYMSPKEGIVVDIDAVGGDTIKSIRFNKGTSADTVMKAIDNYFKGGNQSELMQFHMQYSEKNIDAWLDALDIDDILDDITGYFFKDSDKKERAPRRVDEVNKRLKAIGLSFNGTKSLAWTDERIEKYLGGGWYGSSNPEYAQAYIAYVTPQQFLNLTVGGKNTTLDMIENESKGYGDLDISKLGDSNPLSLYIHEVKNKAEVEGHEGRHRMYLLGKAGFEKVPVLLFDYRTKYEKTAKGSLKLTAQRYNDTDFISKSRDVVLSDLIPFSNGNKDLIIEKFGSGANADIQYSDKGSDGEELGSYYKNLARKLERENDYLKIRHENYKARIEKARRIEQITKKATRMNNLLKKNSKDYHVPEILKEPLEAVLAALDFSSKSFLKKGEPTGKDVRLAEAFSNLQDVLIDIDKAQIKEEDINGVYGHFDMPEGFVEYVRDVKQSINDTIGRMSGEPVVLNRLTKDELDNIYDILTILNKSITQMDKALSTTKSMKISAIADSSKTYLESIHKMGDELPLMQRMKKFLAWDNVLPVYGMSRFGEGGDIIMESLQNGWDKLAFNVDRVVKYSNDVYSKDQLKEWEKSTKKFTVANGNKRKEITLTDAQVMSLYCLSKRDQAMKHILGNGITIASHKTKSDGKIKFDKLTQKDHALITEKELNTIISSLSSEQRAAADALQKFMNTVCAEWGNQVSMVRFGIKSFGEENYFPIKSDANVTESKASESGDSLFRLLNLSFTKSLTKNANNAIMVESVFDVFANHASDMAKYNALALPVLDAFKWYSAKGTVRDKNGRIVDSWSLKRMMDDAYGEAAKGFVRGLLLDMNGASSGGQDLVADSIAKKMMSNYKVASVAANLRVAVLQPTSYMRAGLVLDKKYLTKALVTSESTLKNAVEKAKETCGIALWKSMGFYDTNISRGVAKLIKHDESVLDVVKDKSLILAEKGDEITWGLLYRACLLEQKEKNPGMSGDALDKAVAERLREVIYKTQVVDSTLTRTQTMRSKSAWSQMLTSFMSEPSVSWSILSDVAFKWMVEARGGNHKRAFAKYGKQMKDAAATYLITATTAAIIGAIPDALRDDDDEKNFGEKFAVSSVQNLLSDVTGLLPYVRDIFNMAQGFQPSRMDQQAFSTIINGIRRLSDGEWTYKDVYTMARGISQASGIPISNVMREFETIWNATVGNIYSKLK